MAGDYSRDTFDPTKHYTRVLKQQGRVDVDADWNENTDLLMHRIVEETRDVIGPAGAPKFGGGFAVGKTAGGDDLTLSPGHIYVDGILCELDGDGASVATVAGQTTFVMPFLILDGRKLEADQWVAITTGDKTQLAKVKDVDPATRTVTIADPLANDGSSRVRRATTYHTQPDFDPAALADGFYTVYLDVWEREMSALDDPEIREIALGGPDTARRMKTTWQVRLWGMPDGSCEEGAEILRSVLPSSGALLAARTAPILGDTDPCHLPPTAGYLGMENQLYRVEVQNFGILGGVPGTGPTFKWAPDNATLEVGIKTITGRHIEVTEIGKDDLFRFQNAQWVEIVDEVSVREGRANPLRKVATVDPASRIVTLESDPPATSGRGLKLRGWKQQTNADENGILAASNAFIPLEYGIEVSFADGFYRPGEYWIIPARTAVHDILWPRYDDNTPEYRPPRGITHHYAPLARIEVRAGKVLDSIKDCRKLFPPLTHICAEDVCFDNKNCKIPDAKNVQQAIDALCARRDFDFYKKMLFGYGVACGLQLECDGAGKQSVTVKKGYAIACDGRDMITKVDESIDLRELPEWNKIVDEKPKAAALSMSLGANGVVEYHVSSYEREGWLHGSALEKAYEDCQKKVIDYLKDNFKRGDANEARVTKPERRLITAWNLLVQLYNPQSGKHVYISEAEHAILKEVYDELRKLLKISNTYCALGALKDFPSYPLTFTADTFFGKGEHTRVRVAPDSQFTFVFGADDRINVFDGPELRFVQTFPDLSGGLVPDLDNARRIFIGSARVLDVAFARDPNTIHVLAELAGKTFIAACDFRKKPEAAWTKPRAIDADERVVQLASGMEAVDVYGLGEQTAIYAIQVLSGDATKVTDDGNDLFEGHFIVLHGTARCFAAKRQSANPKGKYTLVAEYGIFNAGRSFRRSNTYVLNASGSEGISYSFAGADLVCALIDKEKATGTKGIVTFFDGPGQRRELPLRTMSPLRVAGMRKDNLALAAIAVADANVVEFVQFDRVRDDLLLPVQICPSDLALNTKNELLAVNHRSHTVSWTNQPATTFNFPGLEKYRSDVLNAFRDLVILMIESIKDCFCEHLQPDCPICTKDDIVYLGVLELDDKLAVRRICPLEKRTWVLSPRNVGYWLSTVPVIPAVRLLFERLCCIDIPKIFEDRFKVPPDGDDRWTCAQIPPFDDLDWDRIRDPLTGVTATLRKKVPFLFDFFARKDEPTDTNMPKPPDLEDLIGQPVDLVLGRLKEAGIPLLDVNTVAAGSGLFDILRPFSGFSPDRPVTLVELDGKVANVHDRVSTREIGEINQKATHAVEIAEQANSRVVDTSEIRNAVDDVRRRVGEAEKKSAEALAAATDVTGLGNVFRLLFEDDFNRVRKTTDESVTREVTRAREDLRRDVGDDVERLRVRVEESRKVIDERDTTIRSLTDTLEKLQGELAEARKAQKDSTERIDVLATKASSVDDLRRKVDRIASLLPNF